MNQDEVTFDLEDLNLESYSSIKSGQPIVVTGLHPLLICYMPKDVEKVENPLYGISVGDSIPMEVAAYSDRSWRNVQILHTSPWWADGQLICAWFDKPPSWPPDVVTESGESELRCLKVVDTAMM